MFLWCVPVFWLLSYHRYLFICLQSTHTLTNTHTNLQRIVSLVGTTGCCVLRGLGGQVLSGFRGMCRGVPLLIVTIFRTLLNKLIAPGNIKPLLFEANYRNIIAWFTIELLPVAQLLNFFVEFLFSFSVSFF